MISTSESFRGTATGMLSAESGSGLSRTIWGLPLWVWLVIGVVAVALLVGLLVWAVRRTRGVSRDVAAQETDAGLPIFGGFESGVSQPGRAGAYAPGYPSGPPVPPNAPPNVPGYEAQGQPWSQPWGPSSGRPGGPVPAWEVPQDPAPTTRFSPQPEPAAGEPSTFSARGLPSPEATQAVSTFAKLPPPPVVDPDDVPSVPANTGAERSRLADDPTVIVNLADVERESGAGAGDTVDSQPEARSDVSEWIPAQPWVPSAGGWPPPAPDWADERR